MAYGYTLLAPYFELDDSSPAQSQTGYLPHPAGPNAAPVAPVGGYMMGIPANLPKERVADAVEALMVFTSPEAQKLYVQNGSRTNPRYSVAADPDVRRMSPIFEAVDADVMARRAAILAAPADPRDQRNHPDLRRRIPRHAARNCQPQRSTASRTREGRRHYLKHGFT